jgi:hypothetical protein
MELSKEREDRNFEKQFIIEIVGGKVQSKNIIKLS